jgi:DNA replication regulator SLD3
MPEASKYNRKKRLAIEAIQSMVKRPLGGVLFTSEILPVSEPQPSTIPDPSHRKEALFGTEPLPSVTQDPAHQEPSYSHVERDDITEQPTADQILDNIRLQYFEALYLSKVGIPLIGESNS